MGMTLFIQVPFGYNGLFFLQVDFFFSCNLQSLRQNSKRAKMVMEKKSKG
jgi:hypothetical protein